MTQNISLFLFFVYQTFVVIVLILYFIFCMLFYMSLLFGKVLVNFVSTMYANKENLKFEFVRPSTLDSSGLNLDFAFFKLIRTLEENILRGLKDWLKKCIFHPKITI